MEDQATTSTVADDNQATAHPEESPAPLVNSKEAQKKGSQSSIKSVLKSGKEKRNAKQNPLSGSSN